MTPDIESLVARLRMQVVAEFIAAWDGSRDPQATGSTCRLIRAESALRAMYDEWLRTQAGAEKWTCEWCGSVSHSADASHAHNQTCELWVDADPSPPPPQAEPSDGEDVELCRILRTDFPKDKVNQAAAARIDTLARERNEAQRQLAAKVGECEVWQEKWRGEMELNKRNDAQLATLRRQLAEREGDCERLRKVLERCRTVLGNMAQENVGALFNRWPIPHEPLRNDAQGLLPDIDAAIALAQSQEVGK